MADHNAGEHATARKKPGTVTGPEVSHDPIISEIRMLLDFVTGSSVQTLKDLAIADPTKQQPASGDPVMIRNADILNRLNEIEDKVIEGKDKLTPQERTFLQFLRDALSAMVRPATGLTIAYSSMVVGRQRGHYRLSRAMRAEEAYPSLAGPARRHRWAQRGLLCLALVVTFLAVWQSAHVALGRSLLQVAQALQTQQLALSADMTKLLEASRPSTAPNSPVVVVGGVPLAEAPILRLCDRPKVLAWYLHQKSSAAVSIDATHDATLFESPAQQALCDRDTILAAQFRIAHGNLIKFMHDWLAVINPDGSLPEGVKAWVQRSAGAMTPAEAATKPGPDAPAASEANQDDVDILVGPVLLVLGNYVLPIVFALLGATVYVILDFYSKLRDNILAPRDSVLSWIRLVLGMVLGACVGLFFSGNNPATAPAGTALADSIALSASGLSFIAGFGVEGVFGMLDSLVRRVFSGDGDKGGRLVQN